MQCLSKEIDIQKTSYLIKKNYIANQVMRQKGNKY